ncbi:MAG: aminomethyl-transferring glycine dehydrogenase [Bacteroidia bacterium]|nr:aminomethyl-transferring glycine dehydrogenase [Bacteroidia bacterium]
MSFDKFVDRHNGPRQFEIAEMCEKIGVSTLDQLIEETVPENIRLKKPLNLPEAVSEFEFLKLIRGIANKNKVFRSYIGMGFYNTITPAVILRNIFENPGWYTSYTPYQAEISQGRLEALLNFQTMVMDLTNMPLANASLLDESTAAAEAMTMMYNTRSRVAVQKGANILFVDSNIFPQDLDVIKTRSNPLGIEVVTGCYKEFEFNEKVFGAIIQYPAANGKIRNYKTFTEKAHAAGSMVAVIADLMALALIIPPGEWGADIVCGSTQRFGIPLGYGGPHAGYFATREEFKRTMPGRIIGITKDAQGNNALRLALQTREQHIKRERATSNICTAQALLATMAGMYAVYHGPEGIKRIAMHIHQTACSLADSLCKSGYKILTENFFDTFLIELPGNVTSSIIRELALQKEINFCYIDDKTISFSSDETISPCDISDILEIFTTAAKTNPAKNLLPDTTCFDPSFNRTGSYLSLHVFNNYHCESEMMRYIKKLERKDFSLTHSMISLGSCTMKLNAAVEMLPVSWAEFGSIHPFAPVDQAAGYHQIIGELEKDLAEITGFHSVSFQPNSGAAGEYTGLMVIRQYHISRGEGHRNVVLIPSSAHGTNPASAVMAGMKVVVVDCDERGNIKVTDLKEKAEQNRENLSAFMVTYPSTHGVFESAIIEMCGIIHKNGGLVYMDGANMNAQVGLTNPATIGADVCHLNLHKTFAIPHGGGGPGVGPIAVSERLASFLPTHSVVKTGGSNGIHAVASAPWGSASILPITYGYIRMLGAEGLTQATKVAILNANYLASSLNGYFKVLYTGEKGRVAHEMILDCHHFKLLADIGEADIAKRMMDYGFHAPTLSFPVHGTLMVEPTESESKQELDRFIETMVSIYREILEISEGNADKTDNVLKNAPHTARAVISDNWNHSYSCEKAAYPLSWIIENKFFASCGRVDDAFGDRNLVCSCSPMDDYR